MRYFVAKNCVSQSRKLRINAVNGDPLLGQINGNKRMCAGLFAKFLSGEAYALGG
jgi:hypothetical protein